ncbi:MAG: DNA methyltransferase Dim-2 [Peltula sp. TS41687]|nr:MAG: DNA methyltransferase Dim-2 [Peltula sp. TS41687]
METRQAPSFPDQDVLIGCPPVQWKIVGNSVARSVALAFVIILRHACAWLANEPDESPGTAARASNSDVPTDDPSLMKSVQTNTTSSRKRTLAMDTANGVNVRVSKRGRVLDDGTLFVEADLPLPVTTASSRVEQTPFTATKRGLLSSTSRLQHISTNSTVQMAQNAPSTSVRGDLSDPLCAPDMKLEGMPCRFRLRGIIQSFQIAERAVIPFPGPHTVSSPPHRPHRPRRPRTPCNVPAIGTTDINMNTPLKPGFSGSH